MNKWLVAIREFSESPKMWVWSYLLVGLLNAAAMLLPPVDVLTVINALMACFCFWAAYSNWKLLPRSDDDED